MFEVRTSREVARLHLGKPVHYVDFTPEGRYLRVVAADEGLWVTQAPLRIDDLIRDTCQKLDRNVTSAEWDQYITDARQDNTCGNVSAATVTRIKTYGQAVESGLGPVPEQ